MRLPGADHHQNAGARSKMGIVVFACVCSHLYKDALAYQKVNINKKVGAR